VQFLPQARNSSLLQNTNTNTLGQPASYSMEGAVAGGKAVWAWSWPLSFTYC